jgi:hypothetical protein
MNLNMTSILYRLLEFIYYFYESDIFKYFVLSRTINSNTFLYRSVAITGYRFIVFTSSMSSANASQQNTWLNNLHSCSLPCHTVSLIIAGRLWEHHICSAIFLYTYFVFRKVLWWNGARSCGNIPDIFCYTCDIFVVRQNITWFVKTVLPAGNHDRIMVFTHSFSHLCWILGIVDSL